MRTGLHDKVGERTPDHVGLGYERWAPIDSSTGKIPDERRRGWLRALAGTPVSDHYRVAFQRWSESLQQRDTWMAEAQVSTRLLIGHGNPSPTEVGLTVHHTWGVPMIPGSALKGLLSHYVDAVYGPAVTGIHPMSPEFPQEERDRAPFRGVTWAGNRIEHGPGEVHRALFGAPAARSDHLFRELGAGETSGLVVFHDALFVPGSNGERPFATDVLTVHQRSYYDHAGKQGSPNDYEDPNPVSFLTVRPETQFLVAMSGPDKWTQLAFGLLRDALIDWGVGGKTTSGYGHLRPDGWNPIWPPPTGIVEKFREWLFAETSSQRKKLELIRTEWLSRLQLGAASEKQEIAKLIRKEINNGKLTSERDKFIAEIVDNPVEPGTPR